MSTVLRTIAAVVTATLYAGIALAQAPASGPAGQPSTNPSAAAAQTPAPGAKPGTPAPATAPPAAQPPGATPPPATATTAAPAAQPPTPPANYEYRVENRRDPFVSLINRGTDSRRSGEPRVVRAADGVAAHTADEIAVRGILNNRGIWIAMVTGPGGKMFTVKAGDRLADGVIREVTPQALIIVQQINDPLSLEKQREVRKPLRGGEVK